MTRNLELTADGPSEGHFVGKSQGRHIDKRYDPVGRYLALCGPEVSRPLPILPPSNAEEVVENQHENLSVDCK